MISKLIILISLLNYILPSLCSSKGSDSVQNNGQYTIVNFDVTLYPYNDLLDGYCINIDSSDVNGAYSPRYVTGSVTSYNGEDNAADLEIVFSTGEYIGTDYNSIGTNPLASWEVLSTSLLALQESDNTAEISGSFYSICFYNNCGQGSNACNARTNEYIGYIQIFGITALPGSVPTSFPTEATTSSASYTQYSTYLRIDFTVTLYSAIYESTYCLSVPTTSQTNTTYFEASFHDTTSNALSDLEIYFSPTGEYIGTDYVGYGVTNIYSWPGTFGGYSGSDIDSGVTAISLTAGFDKVCFANNCGGSYGCNQQINTFLGHINLYGISTESTSPTVLPTVTPTNIPSNFPTEIPTNIPTTIPTNIPTASPTNFPTAIPSVSPTTVPTNSPSLSPTNNPTITPSTFQPSNVPTTAPSNNPTTFPTVQPTVSPTLGPTTIPSNIPTVSPTGLPTFDPTVFPSFSPTLFPSNLPSYLPTVVPSAFPTVNPTNAPTLNPTISPTFLPSTLPTDIPTVSPTIIPTAVPTNIPTVSPSTIPTFLPTFSPTLSPTLSPTTSPTNLPTLLPTNVPTVSPSNTPTSSPTTSPSTSPTTLPTLVPTNIPTVSPTNTPSTSPTTLPTTSPSTSPTTLPTSSPTTSPTLSPTTSPTVLPTPSPTELPTLLPTTIPTFSPTLSPTTSPTVLPTPSPTELPTLLPTTIPTFSPTLIPTTSPTVLPTPSPTILPTLLPTTIPTFSPTLSPTTSPTLIPSSSPSVLPTLFPTSIPSFLPSISPSTSPTVIPTNIPTTSPTINPTQLPTLIPTLFPTSTPTTSPTPAPFTAVYDWSEFSSSEQLPWKVITTSGSGQYIYAAATYGYIYKSSDYGSTFNVSYNSQQSWKALYTRSTGDIIIAAVYDGYVYYSVDYGTIWYTYTTTTKLWTSLCFPDTIEYFYITVSNDYIYKYYGGLGVAEIADWKDIACDNNGYSYAVARNGNIWKGSAGVWSLAYNKKKQWSAISVNSNGTYIYAAVDGEQIYLSTDYGASWSISYSKYNIWSSISVNNLGSVYASDSLGKVYQGSNEGSWTKAFNTNQLFTAIVVSNNDVYVYATAFNGYIYGYYVINQPTSSPTASPTLAPWIEISGVDFPGNDITYFSCPSGPSAESLCLNTPSCVAIVYGTDTGYCFLKTALTPSTALTSLRLAYTLKSTLTITGMDFYGNDLSVISGTTYAYCQLLCSSNSLCIGALFYTNINECHLKSQLVASGSNEFAQLYA